MGWNQRIGGLVHRRDTLAWRREIGGLVHRVPLFSIHSRYSVDHGLEPWMIAKRGHVWVDEQPFPAGEARRNGSLEITESVMDLAHARIQTRHEIELCLLKIPSALPRLKLR
jgi:hypothetical protein